MAVPRIAIIGCPDEVANMFASMLRIVSGMTRSRWQLVDDFERADVVVTASADLRAIQGQGNARSKRHIALVEHSSVRPPTPYVLNPPFRVMQVVSMLDAIDDDMTGDTSDHGHASVEVSGDGWAFVKSLRELPKTIAPNKWYRTRVRNGRDIWVAGDLSCYACDASTVHQVRTAAVAPAALAMADPLEPPPMLVRRPLLELCWHSAYFASESLAPWLNRDAAFRIRRWPDFGALPPTRARLQIIASMAARAQTRAEMTTSLAAPAIEINRTLNALSVCGLLIEQVAQPTPMLPAFAQPPARVTTLIRSFLSGMRSRFGFGD